VKTGEMKDDERVTMTNKRRADIYIDRAVWAQFTKKVKGFSPSRVLEVILQSIMGKDTPTKQLYRRAERLELIIQKKLDPPKKKKR
jgi:predicted ATP-grasp superfamily ATP-dependent carboligase